MPPIYRLITFKNTEFDNFFRKTAKNLPKVFLTL